MKEGNGKDREVVECERVLEGKSKRMKRVVRR